MLQIRSLGEVSPEFRNLALGVCLFAPSSMIVGLSYIASSGGEVGWFFLNMGALLHILEWRLIGKCISSGEEERFEVGDVRNDTRISSFSLILSLLTLTLVGVVDLPLGASFFIYSLWVVLFGSEGEWGGSFLLFFRGYRFYSVEVKGEGTFKLIMKKKIEEIPKIVWGQRLFSHTLIIE